MSNKSMMEYEQEALKNKAKPCINYHKNEYIKNKAYLPEIKNIGDCYLLSDTHELAVYDGNKWDVLGGEIDKNIYLKENK